MFPPFFNFNLSSPSGNATCSALHAIRRFCRQHCSRSSDPDKFTFSLHFHNFSSVFREILIVSGNRQMHLLLILYYLKGLLSHFCFSSKRYQIPFCSLQKGKQSTAYKIGKNLQYERILDVVIKYLLAACKRVSDCLQSDCRRLSRSLQII